MKHPQPDTLASASVFPSLDQLTWACRTRRRYATWTSAKNAATLLRLLSKHLEPYTCAWCAGVHLCPKRSA